MTSPIARGITGAVLAAIGLAHLERRIAFEGLVPPWLRALERDLQVLTGSLEIVGGAAMLLPPLRGFSRPFNVGLRALSVLIAIDTARHPERARRWSTPVPDLRPDIAAARVPMQIGAAGLVWWATRHK